MDGSTPRRVILLAAGALLVAGLTAAVFLIRAGGDPSDAATWPITWELRSSDNGVLFQVMQDVAAGRVDANIKALLAFEISRAHELYRSAEPGIDLLHPSSRDCVRTAFRLYRGILDAVERNGYRVLDRRAQVSLPRRMAVAAPAWARARRAR